MILNRFILLLSLLLAFPVPRLLSAVPPPGDSAAFLGAGPPGGSATAEPTAGRLQLAATLGEQIPLELEEAWQKNSENVQVGLALLRYYMEQQDNSRALTLAKQLYALQPANPQVLKALTLSLLAGGDPNAALKHAEKLTELLPHASSSWHLLSLAHSRKPDIAQAHLALDRALALQPENLDALELKARLYISEKRFKEAHEIARSMRISFPKKPIGYQYDADIYMQQQDFAKAVAAFQTAFDKAPSTALALALANAQWRAGNQTDAFKTLKSWLASNPKDMMARTLLMTYLDFLQRYPEAIAEAETMSQQEPNNGIVLSNLATLYQQVGDKRALGLAERAMQLAPDSPEVADTLGWILVQSKQLPRGLELIRQAITQKPDEPVIAYHLAAAYAQAGQREAALQELAIVTRLLQLAQDRPSPRLMEDVKKLQASLQQE